MELSMQACLKKKRAERGLDAGTACGGEPPPQVCFGQL